MRVLSTSRAVTAVAATVAVVVSGAVTASATPRVVPVAKAAKAAVAQSGPSAPDEVSAQLTARAKGSPVEVESLRTETSSTWANPDGTMTTRQHGGPIRYRDAKGKWVDVNLSMASRADGTAGPKGHAFGLSVAGGTKGAAGGARSAAGTELAAVNGGSGASGAARQVVLGWPGVLPAPTLNGDVATYANAAPGVDVVVESRRTG